MKLHLLTTLLLAALALASCGKQSEPLPGNAGMSNDMSAATNAGAGSIMAPASAGQTFANAAAASDMFEIESSRLAASNGASASVKRFAQSMIEAHTGSTDKLKAAIAQATPAMTPDPTLNAEQQQTLDMLRGKQGAEFDAAYVDAQRKAHQMTLDTLKAYAANGDVSSLKTFATEMVPVVTGHLNMAKGLKP